MLQLSVFYVFFSEWKDLLVFNVFMLYI